MSTAAQINANRANSQLSSGPKTEAGKAASSLNALKSALTGKTVLLPTDDAPAHEKLAQAMIDHYRPATYEEQVLVQNLTDTTWRLQRIPCLEAGIYAVGHRECADLFPPETLNAAIFLKYERQIRNLNIQESRLRRMYDKDRATLRQIQAERKDIAQETQAAQKRTQATAPAQTIPASALALLNEAKQAAAANPSLDISQIGFDFSNASQAKKEAA